MPQGHQVHILSGSQGGGVRNEWGRAGGVRSDQNSLPRTTWMERDLRARLTVGRRGCEFRRGAPACDRGRPIVIKAPRSDTDHFHPRSICPSTDCPGPTPTWHQVPPGNRAGTGAARSSMRGGLLHTHHSAALQSSQLSLPN